MTLRETRVRKPAQPRGLRRIAALGLAAIGYSLSGLTPRSPTRWVFGQTSNLFGGNPKYLFLWIKLHRPDIHATWITGSAETARMLAANGYRVRRRWSPAGIWAALRAGIFVFAHGVADVNLALGRNAFLVNLWHGVGIKTTYLGYKGGGENFARRRSGLAAKLRSWLLAPSDIVVTTSDFMQTHFASQFELPPERCPQLGYPRLDGAFDSDVAEAAKAIDNSCGFTLNPGGFDEIYLYVPTYRDTGRPFLEEALPDPDRLAAALATRKALLYIKPHLLTAEEFPTGHANIRRWPEAIDFHTYLPDFTGLITDYSSVLYDYLYVRDAGAILYIFDFDDYVSADRWLLYPFEDNVAGLRVVTFDALCRAIEQGTALDASQTPQMHHIRDRFWGGSPKPASPAVIAFVEANPAGKLAR
jgi:CDP-glycerol glycerophosphotransferase (TagB/SpsB family)